MRNKKRVKTNNLYLFNPHNYTQYFVPTPEIVLTHTQLLNSGVSTKNGHMSIGEMTQVVVGRQQVEERKMEKGKERKKARHVSGEYEVIKLCQLKQQGVTLIWRNRERNPYGNHHISRNDWLSDVVGRRGDRRRLMR